MKTIIKIFICLSLIYTPMFANAANVGGWNLSNPVAQGASTAYDATKNVLINGKDFIKNSSVKIKPNATQVAKVLAGGAAGYALSVAVEQLLGSVDWVLDPANNMIKYKPKDDPTKMPNYPYVFKVTVDNKIQYFSTEAAARAAVTPMVVSIYSTYVARGSFPSPLCSDMYSPHNQTCATGSQTIPYGTSSSGWSEWRYYGYATVNNPAYDPSKPQEDNEEKSIPLSTVAAQVINNAEQGDTRAQVATVAAAQDIINEAETDQTKARPIVSQAEANAETKPADEDAAANANTGAATATPQADPVTGEQAPPTDISLEFPVFCNWAPTICEAAQVVISFPQTLTGWWESANQKADYWATSISDAYHDFMSDDELPNDDTTLDISEIPTPELQENAISWGAACPADVSIPISMQGVSSTLVFSWGPWCQLLSIIKPAIIASAYIGAAFIVLGLRT